MLAYLKTFFFLFSFLYWLKIKYLFRFRFSNSNHILIVLLGIIAFFFFSITPVHNALWQFSHSLCVYFFFCFVTFLARMIQHFRQMLTILLLFFVFGTFQIEHKKCIIWNTKKQNVKFIHSAWSNKIHSIR